MQIKGQETKLEERKAEEKKGDKRIALALENVPNMRVIFSPGRRENSVLSQPWKITYWMMNEQKVLSTLTIEKKKGKKMVPAVKEYLQPTSAAVTKNGFHPPVP